MSTNVSKILTYYLKINLLRLHHWYFPGKCMNFSEAATGGVLWKRLFLKISQYTQESCRPATLFKKTPTEMFSSAYCDFFRNTYFEVNMLKAASDFLKQLQRWAAASELSVLLTLSRRRSLSYRNHSIDLRSKSMDWFLCDYGLRLERVKFRYLITVYEQVKLFTIQSKFINLCFVSKRLIHVT